MTKLIHQDMNLQARKSGNFFLKKLLRFGRVQEETKEDKILTELQNLLLHRLSKKKPIFLEELTNQESEHDSD